MYRIVNARKRRLTMAADWLGRLAFALPRLLRGAPEPLHAVDPDRVRKILVIRTAYVGDVLLTMPMLAPLAARFPQAEISVLTAPGAAPLLWHNPLVARVLTCAPFWFYPASPKHEWLDCVRRLRQERFDLVIEARGDIREILGLARLVPARWRVSYAVGGGAFALTHVVPHPAVNHRVLYHLDIARFLGASVDPEHPDWGLVFTPEEREWTEDLLRRKGLDRGCIAVHPGARAPLKVWLPERYALSCDLLSRHSGLPVVLLGTQSESAAVAAIVARMQEPSVNLAGQLGLRELGALMSRASLVVCNDSAPMHLAVACGAPVAALFGPSKPEQTGPWSPRSVVVARDFPCRESCDETTCTHPEHQACLRAITPEDLVTAALPLLG